MRIAALTALVLAATAALASAQPAPPAVRAGVLATGLVIDGKVDDAAWDAATAIDQFTEVEPVEGRAAAMKTTLRALAGPSGIAISLVCHDSEPARIVSYSVRRDAWLESEDHVAVVIGPFLDGRSGYVFAVNPSGARYDALIAPGGEEENSDWDGIWEARAVRTPDGWSAEFWIPIQTLSFRAGAHEWEFNVQRRIQRLLETDRWASPQRQYSLTQMSQAGRLTDLPEFDLGVGLTVRPALSAGGGIPAPDAAADGHFQPSLDVWQRLGANVTASATVNTDFAETEVDTRRTNLTRFPLFFPEKRAFFLDGADTFTFGLGLGEDVVPYFSRRIGLIEGREVPIGAGGKVNGRAGAATFGGLVAATRPSPGVMESWAQMGVAREKRNVWRESWIGAIATVGDPLGRPGSWLGGADFTYSSSRLHGDKNFLVGLWGLATRRDDLHGDRSAAGLKVDYPNDPWELSLTSKRIGGAFDPSLGFVPRRGVYLHEAGANYSPRFEHGPIQQMFFELEPTMATDLSGRWESYEVFAAPINWRFRSGDRIEVNVSPAGERLIEPFEITDGVTVAPGTYDWRRYRLEAGTAEKRRLYAQVTWWFGGFYDGHLDQFEWEGAWNPAPIVTIEFSGERNVGRLSTGNFTQTVTGTRLRMNFSPDLSLSAYLQYDTESQSVGTNTRLRWTFTPPADLFVVYNHNVRSILDRWRLDSNQVLVKIQYAFRM